MLQYGIPSYKLEKDVIEAEIEVMRQMGVEIKTGVEVGKDVTLNELREQGYKAFYLAMAAARAEDRACPATTQTGRLQPSIICMTQIWGICPIQGRLW